MQLGQRCQLNVGNRRGEVKFIGKVAPLGAGFWIGVQLDEPTGDSNGTVKGKQHFECPDKFGTFVRPADMAVGDYPPEDDLDDELDMI